MRVVLDMSAEDVSWWANWILVGALLVGVAATYAIVVSGNIKEANLKRELRDKDDAFDRYKIDAGKQISAANAVGEAAKADVEKAHAEIAKANAEIAAAKKQAAALEKDTAQARLEQERLKQMVVWRDIPADAGRVISSVLATQKHTILIAVLANDPEAMAFASRISKILDNAGWTAVPRAVSWGAWLPIGLHVYGPENDAVRLLLSAFAAAKIEVDPRPPPHDPDWSIVFQQGTETTATILVGSKLGPLP